MKAKIFMLGDPAAAQDEALNAAIAEVFKKNAVAEDAIRQFDSVRSATTAISRAFSEADLVMFLVQEEIFSESTELLCKALGIRLQENEKLLELAKRGVAEDADADPEAFSRCHAYLPRKAKAFALSDALYTGFAVIKGVQTVVFLPYSTARTVNLLGAQVIPYLNTLYDEGLDAHPLQLCYANVLMKALKKANVSVTVAGNNMAKLIVKYMNMIPGLKERMPVSERKAEPRGRTLPREYALNLSVTAAEFMGLPYGVAMTNAYCTQDDPAVKTVYIAVTDENETAVRAINSLYGEPNAEFMLRCCGELCRLLADRVTNGGRAAAAASPQARRRRYITRIIVVAVLLGLVTGGGIWYFRKNNYTLKMWLARYLPAFSQSEEEDELDAIPFEEANYAGSDEETAAEDAAAEPAPETAETENETGAPETETAASAE